jgi:RimJ/RimL family protein N-acetyltransferase
MAGMSRIPLETKRLILRRWRAEDLVPFRRVNADPRVMEFYPAVLSAEHSDRIVERAQMHFREQGFGLLAAELKETGAFLGFVGLQRVPFDAPFTPAVEIGWRIGFEHWNRGYATEAARAVLDHAFGDLKLGEIVAMTYRGNHRSRRVMEKLGMAHDPKDDFDNPHPALEGTVLVPHVLYRLRAH